MKTGLCGAGKRAQLPGACTALTQDLSLVPNTDIWQLTNSSNPSPRERGSLGQTGTRISMHITPPPATQKRNKSLLRKSDW